MIRAAIAFFVLALIAYVLGAYGVVGVSLAAGKSLLVVFLILAILSYGVSLLSGGGRRQIP